MITNPHPYFNSGLAKRPLKLGYGWVITPHREQWKSSPIHAVIPISKIYLPCKQWVNKQVNDRFQRTEITNNNKKNINRQEVNMNHRGGKKICKLFRCSWFVNGHFNVMSSYACESWCHRLIADNHYGGKCFHLMTSCVGVASLALPQSLIAPVPWVWHAWRTWLNRLVSFNFNPGMDK